MEDHSLNVELGGVIAMLHGRSTIETPRSANAVNVEGQLPPGDVLMHWYDIDSAMCCRFDPGRCWLTYFR